MQIIQTITVGAGGVNSIEFANIPAVYTDLKLVTMLRTDRNTGFNSDLYVTFNSSATNYSGKKLYVAGTTVGAATTGATNLYPTDTNQIANNTASTFTNIEIYIANYTSANNKAVSVDAAMENNSASNELNLYAGLWSNSAAITTITLTPIAGGFKYVQYSSASLYGIKNS